MFWDKIKCKQECKQTVVEYISSLFFDQRGADHEIFSPRQSRILTVRSMLYRIRYQSAPHNVCCPI